jgi:hypothetical protein
MLRPPTSFFTAEHDLCLVDVDPVERVVTLDGLKAAWTPMTKVVMPVDLAGWPVDYEAIANWLSKAKKSAKAFQPNNPEIQQKAGTAAVFSGCGSFVRSQRYAGATHRTAGGHHRVQFPRCQKLNDSGRRST